MSPCGSAARAWPAPTNPQPPSNLLGPLQTASVRNIGAPRDVLATRLRRLVDAGVLHKHVYSERPQRFEYRPTRAGLELEPVLMTLMAWGDRHLREDDDRPMVIEHSCGNKLVPRVTCTACDAEIHHDDVTAHPRPLAGR